MMDRQVYEGNDLQFTLERHVHYAVMGKHQHLESIIQNLRRTIPLPQERFRASLYSTQSNSCFPVR